MAKLSLGEKQIILNEVFKRGESVASVCRRWKISRQSFYKWLRYYKPLKNSKNETDYLKKPERVNVHYKSVSKIKVKNVLDLVLKHPDWSAYKISNFLKAHLSGRYYVSAHGVSNLFKKFSIEALEARKEFTKKRLTKTAFPTRFSDFEKYKLIEEVQNGRSISEVCKLNNISRQSFYKWFAKYKNKGVISALSSKRPTGLDHWKSVDEKVKGQILSLVAANPEFSVHKIHALMAGSVGHHGVQNVLAREGLNTYEARQDFSARVTPEVATPQLPDYEVPTPRLSVWRLLYAPFETVPKFFYRRPYTWPVVLPLLALILFILEAERILYPAYFFPTLALTFGTLFFLYSLKYYISLIIVLWLSQTSRGDSGTSSVKSRSFSSNLGRLLRIYKPITRVNPLLLNLDKVILSRRPFVSIHVAVYNERKVIERLIKACTSQKWERYELVIVDDSRDETTKIAKELLSQNGRELKTEYEGGDKQVYISEVMGGPTVKYIHRFSRTGYKGAALSLALEHTDKRAEFVAVFDSDFIPYPDTLEQFVKSFQSSCGGLDNLAESKIAAVQGYQWHVLNKSENWVTRGVRTEYAGSYVIERAGIGVYGGLNMIAGSVFCIRADILKKFGWGTSITEDLQLTLRLYEKGFKVVFTPYIQAPAEAVSTVRRLIRQRMRWAEGHTYNMRKMWKRLLNSQYMSEREKFESIYLAPYYLQAAFFLIGTFSWFVAEVIIRVNLPFWTSAWGWSLIFTNFLALPMMNLVGLFLEESDERDYLGVTSFLILSYLLVPFQAYAAVKALFEKSEGPWFRTPKTGSVTDVFSRIKLYSFFEKFKLVGGRGKSRQTSIFNREMLGQMSAFNPLSGYSIKPKRVPAFARAFIALLLIATIGVNYLAFFAPVAEADGTTPAVEQQINISNSARTTTSTSYTPTDNSYGLVLWDADVYDGTVTTYFDAVFAITNMNETASVALFDSSGTEVSGSEVTLTGVGGSFQRKRSSAITLTDDTQYTTRFKTSNSSATVTLNSSRIIITQTDATKITKTETQVEMGLNTGTAITSYTLLTSPKIYCFDSTATSSSCDAASPTRFSPAPTIYFEATATKFAGGTGNIALFAQSDGLCNSTASQVSSSELSFTSASYTRVRSSAITLTAGTDYCVGLKNTSGTSVTMANAKLILQQEDASGGITALETAQLYVNNSVAFTATSWNDFHYDNQLTTTNFSGTLTYFYDNVSNYTDTKSPSGTPKHRIGDGTQELGETTATTTVTRRRSSISPTTGEFDAQGLCDSCSGRALRLIQSQLLIQIQSMPVPEIALLALPGSLFLPKVIRWWKDKKERRKKEKLNVRPR